MLNERGRLLGKPSSGFAGIVLGASLLLGLASVVATAQVQTAPPTEPKQPTHEERPSMPPAPKHTPVTSPPLSPDMLRRGTFQSVQVNVDANGNNIVGDAANEPTIDVDPTNPNIIVIGWRQFDDIRSDFRQSGRGYSHDGGRTWTFPGPLEPGKFGSDPVVIAGADGTFYYVGIDFSEVRFWRSFDGGVDFGNFIQVIPTFRDKEWMTIDRTDGIGRDNIYMTWSNTRNFTRSTDGGLTWMNPITIPIGRTVWGTLSVDPEGLLYVVDRNFNVARSDNAQDPNQTPAFSFLDTVNLGGSLSFGGPPNPGGLLGQPWIVTDHSDGESRCNVYLLCSVDVRGRVGEDVMFARSTDHGQTWSAPVRVNDDPTNNSAYQWLAAMSVAPSGRIDAVWFDTRNSGQATRSELFYAYSTDTGATWSENIPVSPEFDSTIGWPQQNKIGDYMGLVSDEIGAQVAYPATFTGGQDVYNLHIAIDCNGNGIHDGDDIASGNSLDENDNGIPDECEGVECNRIRKFRVKCNSNNGKLRAKVRSSMPEGTLLLIDNNGDQKTMTLGSDGKGKVKWFGQSGSHTVTILDCPDFTRTVDCGG